MKVNLNSYFVTNPTLQGIAMNATSPAVDHANATLRPEAVRHATLEVDGVSVFYREAGRADAPVVLLLHGFCLLYTSPSPRDRG